MKLPDSINAWFRTRGKVVRKRRVASLSPSRRSQRLTEKNAARVATAELESSIQAESFALDTVAIRLRETQRRKRARDEDGVCSFSCSQPRCNHPRAYGPVLNYTP